VDAASDLRQAHRTAVFITGALMTSPVLYAVVASALHPGQTSDPRAGLPPATLTLLRYGAWIMSTVVVLGLPLLRRALLTRRPEDTHQRGIARLTLTTVATGALAEFPALAGFLLVVLGGFFLDFYLLASLSLVLLLAYAPRYDAWTEWLAAPAPRP
jgi:hypothetical protein